MNDNDTEYRLTRAQQDELGARIGIAVRDALANFVEDYIEERGTDTVSECDALGCIQLGLIHMVEKVREAGDEVLDPIG